MMKQTNGKTAVTLTNAVKRYGDVAALRGVSLVVAPGETVAILGPNGAGKTTAVSAMLGLCQLTEGTATIYGRSPHHPASRARIGAMLQDSGIPDTLKVWEIVDMFQRLYSNPYTVEKALDIAQLQEKANTRIAKLSGGQKQRLYFALVIIGNPDVLFLDEPTVALDVQGRRAFWQQMDVLAEMGKTIILTTHYLEEADAVADRIIVLDKGQIIAEGTPTEIKARTGGKHIRFRAPQLNGFDLSRLPGVERVTKTADSFQLFSRQPEATLAQIFQNGPAINDLEVVGAGLEEAFLALTQSA